MKKKRKKVQTRGRPLKITKRLRIPKTFQEDYLKTLGYKKIAGMDEVGRGAWAGPIVAATVVLPSAPQIKNLKVKTQKFYGLRDSKLLTSLEREKLAMKIRRKCRFAIGKVEVGEINQLGLTWAISLAYQRALKQLSAKIDFLLVDGWGWKEAPLASQGIKKGDMNCASIAAASIVAKVYRDKLMEKLSKRYQKWQFEKHKGYGTKLHRDLIKKYGVCAIHRENYRPIKNLMLQWRTQHQS